MYKQEKQKNGLDVIVAPMPQMSSVSLGIWVGIGGRYEKPELSGMSHLVEHMLFKGTHSRTAKALKEAVEGIGGAFNGFTSDEVTCYMVKVPAKYLDLGMEILSDMVLNPSFDKRDLAKEKFVICEEIKMYKDQPADHVMDLLGEIMWSGSPLGRPLTGTISTVKGFKKEQMVNFKEESYHPGNISVIAAGKLTPGKLFGISEKIFAGKKKRKLLSFDTPKMKQGGSRVKIVKSKTSQTHIAMGFYSSADTDEERFAIKIMNTILGGNMSSRLFEELREKYGLCYDISSAYKRHSDVGEMHIHAGVDSKKAAVSVSAILEELKKIRDLGVAEDELVRAKEYSKGQFLLAMEGTYTRMLWLGDRLMVHGEIPEVKDVLKNLDNVTQQGIKTACENIFKSKLVNLAVVGNMSIKDKNKIRKELDTL